jgi:hypothetical protein
LSGNQLPPELGDAWSRLSAGSDARKLRGHLPALEQSVLLVKRLEDSVKEAFEGVQPERVDPGKRAEVRTSLASAIQTHALSINSVLKLFSRLSAETQGAVQEVLRWMMSHLVAVLTAFSDHLALQSWSIEATGSLPPGVTFSITLTFA